MRLDETTMAPDRGAGTGFGATVNDTVASPWPLVVARDTQLESTDTDQVQSRVVEIAIDPLPPVGGNGAAGGLPTVTSHLAALGLLTDVDVLLQCANSREAARVTADMETHLPIRIRSTTRHLMHGARQRGRLVGVASDR